jgi:Rieske Fe-S protein
MSDCDQCRRGLLRAGAAGAVLLLPGCSASTASVGTDAGDDGPGDDGAADGGLCASTCSKGTKTLVFLFADYPALQSVGGSALNNAPGYKDPSCGLDIVIVAQPTAGQYVAYSAACSHQCCTVSYRAARNEFACPCHGSTFGLDGKVTGGPAPTALAKLEVCADSCGVYVSYP